MSVDTIGDFLTIIRNGVLASKREVVAPYSNLKYEIAQILKAEGFVRDALVQEGDDSHKQIKLSLKYVDGESAIHEIKRISTPGRRNYKGVASVNPVIGGLGITILTTNRGVITNKKARQLSVGGEVLCTVW
ncbi:30S ribosomal protein S8 [Candidatus Dependentiae bacterium]|nr:30S ribosomal protein S8 [Candidatus Dependentiae bacterium]